MVTKRGNLLRQNKYCNKTFFFNKSNIIYSDIKKYGFHLHHQFQMDVVLTVVLRLWSHILLL